jgi:hypothetical protein
VFSSWSTPHRRHTISNKVSCNRKARTQYSILNEGEGHGQPASSTPSFHAKERQEAAEHPPPPVYKFPSLSPRSTYEAPNPKPAKDRGRRAKGFPALVQDLQSLRGFLVHPFLPLPPPSGVCRPLVFPFSLDFFSRSGLIIIDLCDFVLCRSGCCLGFLC